MDSHGLERVLLNLVTNAVDALATQVTIRTERVDDAAAPGVRITIKDNGAGMDSATLARAFDPHFTTKSTLGHGGLGLGTVRSLIVEAGGRVSAMSVPGVGTEIVVELPRA